MTNINFEIERDMGGIILDHPVYCGYCLRPMESVGHSMYVCSGCGRRYDSSYGDFDV